MILNSTTKNFYIKDDFLLFGIYIVKLRKKNIEKTLSLLTIPRVLPVSNSNKEIIMRGY
jgi:hypothetical protein